MLRIIHSNRTEELLEALLAARAAAPAPGFAPDTMIVPSAGMGRWLTFEIARREGIACNLRCAYLAAWAWELYAAVLPQVPARSPFEAQVMAWRLHEALGGTLEAPELAPLRRYLDGRDARGRMALAQRIAAVYSHYLVYRPDWLAAWGGGRRLGLAPAGTESWQAFLWRSVLAPAAALAPADPQEAALAELGRRARAGAPLPGLPPVLRVFALPALAPVYAQLLAELARWIEVELYVLDPCREFWADIVSAKELARRRLQEDPGSELLEVGNELLASWGRQARDHLALLAALIGEEGVVDEARFVEPGVARLLPRLQGALLRLQALELPPGGPAPDDDSLQLHACHSLTRQLEVLHDQLLARFAADPGLQPGEVLVLLPDLAEAAPLIDAVFGTVPRERHIPYAIRGAAAPGATPLLRAFAALLALPRARFEAAAVAELLAVPALARRHGLAPEELERIDEWLRAAGVRWGLDGAHRARFGVPGEERHTWADGLARLLLGYALPAAPGREFGGLLPCPAAEGAGALALGKLVRVLVELAGFAEALRTPRPVADWCGWLARALERLFDARDEELPELQRIGAAIAAVAEQAERAQQRTAVAFEALALCLERELAGLAPGAVPTGSVSFCPLGALRGLPYRVVCVLGLDDGAFPRNPAPAEFDLAAARPRLGDPARRSEDRGAFLDALLGAREHLLLFYTGASAQDNAPLPPSILVTELVDALAGGAPLDSAPRAALLARLCTRHRLQPFSPRYFDGGPLFSYATDMAQAAAGAGTARDEGVLGAPLAPPEASWRRVDAEALAYGLVHPARRVLRERLHIELRAAAQQLPGSEPFVLEREDGWALDERLLAALHAGAGAAQALRLALAGTELPHGPAGQTLARERVAAAGQFLARLQRLGPPAWAPALPFACALGPFELTGAWAGLQAGGQVGWQLRPASAGARLAVWLRHLALCHAGPAGAAPRTHWMFLDREMVLGPVADAGRELAHLLELYWAGLSRPPRFMGRTALALLDETETRAQGLWHNAHRRSGEALDPWYRLAFGAPADPGPIPAELRALAAPVFGRMVAAERATPEDA